MPIAKPEWYLGTCGNCNGSGIARMQMWSSDVEETLYRDEQCENCEGEGNVPLCLFHGARDARECCNVPWPERRNDEPKS